MTLREQAGLSTRPPPGRSPVKHGDVSWDRMIRAVERVRGRLGRAVAALEAAGLPYAVAAWVSRVDEAAVRNTQDVDILLRRADLPAAIAAMSRAGLVHRHTAGAEMYAFSRFNRANLPHEATIPEPP